MLRGECCHLAPAQLWKVDAVGRMTRLAASLTNLGEIVAVNRISPISWGAPGSVLSAITRPSGANYPTTKEPEHVRPSPDLPAMRSTVHGGAIRRSLLLALVSTAL